MCEIESTKRCGAHSVPRRPPALDPPRPAETCRRDDRVGPLAGCRASRGESGSAFLIALLVLVVLTIAGLALTLITQTEVRIGANERTTNRAFYAADSGISVSLAWRVGPGNLVAPTTFYINTTQQDTTGSTGPTTATATFSDQVTVSPTYVINSQPCPLSGINMNGKRLKLNNNLISASSQRTFTPVTGGIIQPESSSPTNPPAVAQKNLIAVLLIMCTQEDPQDLPPPGTLSQTLGRQFHGL